MDVTFRHLDIAERPTGRGENRVQEERPSTNQPQHLGVFQVSTTGNQPEVVSLLRCSDA